MSGTLIDSTHTSPLRPEQPLSDLVGRYAGEENLPETDWLTRLHLQSPRQDIRSLNPPARFLKRSTDLAVATMLLVTFAPVMAVVAVLVKLSSPGPIIFRQTRVGLNLRRNRGDRRCNGSDPASAPDGEERRRAGGDRRQQFHYGKPFTLYKFRTMRTDAEQAGARFAEENDPRITPVGRFLRKYRLDELPQLWNVLKGEMSLVGPRPERPEFIAELSREIPDYLHRLGLKPGLTGLAQVTDGYTNNVRSFRRKVAFDLLYLQNCCFTNDLKILLRTIGVVLTGRGAL